MDPLGSEVSLSKEEEDGDNDEDEGDDRGGALVWGGDRSTSWQVQGGLSFKF